jgi:hypothetical protein
MKKIKSKEKLTKNNKKERKKETITNTKHNFIFFSRSSLLKRCAVSPCESLNADRLQIKAAVSIVYLLPDSRHLLSLHILFPPCTA